MRRVQVIGGGPAGAAAAIAALNEGAGVTLAERSRFPRHKVCGEFLTPQIVPALEQLGVWPEVERLGPAPIRRVVLHMGARERSCGLPEGAFGLSRYALDEILFHRAVGLGAKLGTGDAADAQVIATGRSAAAPRGNRLFGFKTHFRGPANDAVELFFFPGGYTGVNPAEGGVTNVCGLAPESALGQCGFDLDAFVAARPALAARVRPLSRAMKWLTTGPLVFGFNFAGEGAWRAGDALGFIDPFTGCGIWNAVSSGRLAGAAAARGTAPGDYLKECRRALGRAFRVSAFLRRVVSAGLAEYLAPLVPARWLYRWTRPGWE